MKIVYLLLVILVIICAILACSTTNQRAETPSKVADTTTKNNSLQTSQASVTIDEALIRAVNDAFASVNPYSKIAVIHVHTSNSAVSDFILGELQHILVNRKYNVVDRADLDKIRKERDFQYTYEVDETTAISVGKFVGADVVVTGQIDGLENLRRLRLKVMNTQTAIIIGTASEPFTSALHLETPSTPSNSDTNANVNPPKNLKGTASGKQVTLNWEKPDDGSPNVYKIFRDGLQTGVAQYSLTFTQIVPEYGTYSYYVIAQYTTSEKETIPSNTVTISVESLPPPTNLTVTSVGKQVTLSWQAPSGATPQMYYIYRDGVSVGTAVANLAQMSRQQARPTTISDVHANNPFTHTLYATDFNPHNYSVKAYYYTVGSSPEESAPSNIVSFAASRPPAPTNFTVTKEKLSGEYCNLIFKWQAPSVTETYHYYIYFDGQAFLPVDNRVAAYGLQSSNVNISINGNNFTYTWPVKISSPPKNHTYYVKSLSQLGDESEPSNSVTISH